MNSNWPRWVYASFAKHFDDNRNGVTLYIEGTDRDTALLSNFAEFRLDGPRIKQISRSIYRLDVSVNVLVQCQLNDQDAYSVDRTIGIMVAAFTPSVNAFKFGAGMDDTQDLFACFERIGGSGNVLDFDVRINRFGIIDETVRKQQATIESRYRADITV